MNVNNWLSTGWIFWKTCIFPSVTKVPLNATSLLSTVGVSFHGVKGSWSCACTFVLCHCWQCTELNIHFRINFHSMLPEYSWSYFTFLFRMFISNCYQYLRWQRLLKQCQSIAVECLGVVQILISIFFKITLIHFRFQIFKFLL